MPVWTLVGLVKLSCYAVALCWPYIWLSCKLVCPIWISAPWRLPEDERSLLMIVTALILYTDVRDTDHQGWDPFSVLAQHPLEKSLSLQPSTAREALCPELVGDWLACLCRAKFDRGLTKTKQKRDIRSDCLVLINPLSSSCTFCGSIHFHLTNSKSLLLPRNNDVHIATCLPASVAVVRVCFSSSDVRNDSTPKSGRSGRGWYP